MSITLSDNISLTAPKPTRTTEVVGINNSTHPGGAPSVYPVKESIPEYMRHLYMETIDGTGKKWVLRNPLDILSWSPVPFPNVEPTLDGVWAIKKVGDTYTWEDASSGGGGGSWGSITGTLSAQTDLQAELDNKANTDGNPMARFEVADAVGNSDAVSLQQFNNRVQTDVPVGAVFDNTQIDPQEGTGIAIDKTDPMAPIFTTALTIVEVTYAELKAHHLAGTLIPGQRYKIVDFKSQWEMDTKEYSGAAGNPYGFDTIIEPLIITAISKTELHTTAFSETYPRHIIEYAPDWDWVENLGSTQPTGEITFRQDLELKLSAGFDYVGFRATRFAVTAPEWVVGDTYARLKTCSVPDPAGDALYISMKAGNTGNDPTDSATDGVWWMLFRPAGADTTSLYRDYVAADWTNAGGYHTDNMAQTDTFGFQVDKTRFQNFPTFAFASDLTATAGKGTITADAIGEVPATDAMFCTEAIGFTYFDEVGLTLYTKTSAVDTDPCTGVTWDDVPMGYEVYYYSHIENKGNVMLAANNNGEYYGNYYIQLDHSVSGMTIVSNYIYQVIFQNMFGGTMKNYIFGAAWAIIIASSTRWFQNNYMEGFSFIDGLGTVDVSADMNKNIFIRKGAARDNLTSRLLNGTSYTGAGTLIYRGGWLHANKELSLYNCNILGELKYNTNVILTNSIVEAGASITNSSIIAHGYASNQTSGYNTGNTITGKISNSIIQDMDKCELGGDLVGVVGEHWFEVKIPVDKNFTDVKFHIPVWIGKNVWSGTPSDISYVTVTKKYIDDINTPTLEKLWYQEIDVNGVATDVEIV